MVAFEGAALGRDRAVQGVDRRKVDRRDRIGGQPGDVAADHVGFVLDRQSIGRFIDTFASETRPVLHFCDQRIGFRRACLTSSKSCRDCRARWIELHTGTYADSKWTDQPSELARLTEATSLARAMGLRVNAGHGLTYQNVEPVAAIEGMEELNIGHTIVARAVAVGLQQAVREMKALVQNPRRDPLFGSY